SCYLIVNKWSPDPFPEWITYIPSLGRKKIIPDFAERLGEKLKLPVYDTISIINLQKQPIHHYNNSQQKVDNNINNWSIKKSILPKPVLLIDDFAYSRWTLTIVGRLLKIAGAEKVYPFTLGSSKDTE
ncbi:MAG TPA: hypothetical protein PKI18_07300, partial [Candidatus Cloacimonas sp.]|nr:hypothetical protein [Candidatus Cloacimonas sp.]